MKTGLDDKMAEQKNYYEILGVEHNATEQEIKAQFRKLAWQTHPDRNPGIDEKPFKQVNEAYEALGNSSRRALYDATVYNIFFKGKEKPSSRGLGVKAAPSTGIPSTLEEKIDAYMNGWISYHDLVRGLSPQEIDDVLIDATKRYNTEKAQMDRASLEKLSKSFLEQLENFGRQFR